MRQKLLNNLLRFFARRKENSLFKSSTRFSFHSVSPGNRSLQIFIRSIQHPRVSFYFHFGNGYEDRMQGCCHSSTLLLRANPFSLGFHTFGRAILVFLWDSPIFLKACGKCLFAYVDAIILFSKESVIYASLESNEYRISVTLVFNILIGVESCYASNYTKSKEKLRKAQRTTFYPDYLSLDRSSRSSHFPSLM